MCEIKFQFGTKAETLNRLSHLVHSATIQPLFYFNTEQWAAEPADLVARIQGHFTPRPLAVRSSSQAEDGDIQSMAGAFTSCLHVDSNDESSIRAAVTKVLASYEGNPKDQVLVQPMVESIAVSGVMTTHVIDSGAPYYVVNYDDESGKTDTITGGTGTNKTVMINREADEAMIESDRVRRWLGLAKELEGLCGQVPLDIEFAQSHSGELFLLQVRRLSPTERWNKNVDVSVAEAQRHIADFFQERSAPRPGLLGSRTILGEMPDWNPAEIIGTNPRPLATSLYRTLVTDEVWRRARASMGYRHPEHETLMVVLGGRPYIDVRNSFNSLLPAGLDPALGHTIVDAWLDHLDLHPELHDKVEFEVAFTALDFDFASSWDARYPGLLSQTQKSLFQEQLRNLTLNCLVATGQGGLHTAIETGRCLRIQEFQVQTATPGQILARISRLIYECIEGGTLPFAVTARHAFIAESQLRSAVRREALTVERLREYKASLTTIAGHMASDLRAVLCGQKSRREFLAHYGHLRPGTYDILSLRYDQREDLFNDVHVISEKAPTRVFQLTQNETKHLSALLKESGLDQVSCQQWLQYCGAAIVGREEVKFHFSRILSEIIELAVKFGASLQLTREHLSYVEIGNLLECRNNPIVTNPSDYFLEVARQGRERMEMTRALRTSYLIRHVRDVYVAPMHRSAPTFVTNARLEARVVHVDSRWTHTSDLVGAIVCIENADPGFDWIFTRGISGLVTQFGGSNSHMAVRSAELGLPAAIGCGEQTFLRLVAASQIELNCADKIVRPLYG